MAAERDDPDDLDEVTQAGIASFPASDPPSYNMPARHRFVPKVPVSPSPPGAQIARPDPAAARLVERPPAPEAPEAPAPPARDSRRLAAWVATISAALLLLGLVLSW